MTERRERGACFCGRITAEMQGEPFWIAFDHDDDCRRATGGALIVWIGYRPEQIRFTSGEPKSFSRTEGIVRTFCPDCGTSIAYMDTGIEDEVYLSLGFTLDPERFCPEAHAYWRMKLPWLELADDLPRIDGYSRQRDPAIGSPRERSRRS